MRPTAILVIRSSDFVRLWRAGAPSQQEHYTRPHSFTFCRTLMVLRPVRIVESRAPGPSGTVTSVLPEAYAAYASGHLVSFHAPYSLHHPGLAASYSGPGHRMPRSERRGALHSDALRPRRGGPGLVTREEARPGGGSVPFSRSCSSTCGKAHRSPPKFRLGPTGFGGAAYTLRSQLVRVMQLR